MTAVNKHLKEVLAPMITGPNPRVRAIAARSITALTKYGTFTLFLRVIFANYHTRAGDTTIKFLELDAIVAFAEVLENETEDGGDNDVDPALMPTDQVVVNKLFVELIKYGTASKVLKSLARIDVSTEITRSLMLKVPTLAHYYMNESTETAPSQKV